eukprot:COSAG01_NODE_4481_length_4985_cov_14.783258_2_plen_59_part_00
MPISFHMCVFVCVQTKVSMVDSKHFHVVPYLHAPCAMVFDATQRHMVSVSCFVAWALF